MHRPSAHGAEDSYAYGGNAQLEDDGERLELDEAAIPPTEDLSAPSPGHAVARIEPVQATPAQAKKPAITGLPLPKPGGPSPGLSLPAPEPSGPGRAARSAPLPDAVPRSLFDQLDETAEARGAGPSLQRMVIAAGIGGVLLLGLVWVAIGRRAPPPPAGMVSIVSDPEGADILIDGQPFGEPTPVRLMNVPAGRRMRISVIRPGWEATPAERELEIVAEESVTAYFALAEVRRLRLETDPPGADVWMNGIRAQGRTPLTLPPAPLDKVARLRISLPGFMPVELEHLVEREGPPLAPVVLRPAVELSVLTEPQGARVLLDGEELGFTPLYEAAVPKGERVNVRVERPGYRPQTRRLRLDHDDELRLTLKEQPLSALKLSREDRRRARELDRAVAHGRRRVRQLEAAVAASERRLDQLLSDPDALFGARAKAEAQLDDTTRHLQEAEDRLYEVRAEVERFRAGVLSTDEP